VLFAVAWVGLQALLILTASARPDGAFGFRMFSESSTMKVALYREIAAADGARTRVHVEDGTWAARDDAGVLRRFSWYDRVWPNLGVFDRETAASYGADAQIARLRGAVEDVAAHIPEDAETRRLVLDVTIRKNGRPPVAVTLTSPERIAR
jgi:hypothetical protein